MSGPKRVVLKHDPYESDCEDSMEFRLTYDGPLMATQRDPVNNQKDARAGHKHEIRRQLHPQLKRLWEVHPFLRNYRIDALDYEWGRTHHPHPGAYMMSHEEEQPLRDIIASRYGMFGYTFVPLVCEDLWLSCAIDILFLRRDPPGAVIQSGDIDNRIKTLMDGLRIPKNAAELVSHQVPSDTETPFFCLLEDDRLITKLAVETDWLLDKPRADDVDDVHNVRLVMKVTIRPETVTAVNMNFA
jgi:hypothetical protein